MRKPKCSECLCSELTFDIYRPPESTNLSTFFEELTTSLSKAKMKYKNLLIICDFNIDMKIKSLEYDKLAKFDKIRNLLYKK